MDVTFPDGLEKLLVRLNGSKCPHAKWTLSTNSGSGRRRINVQNRHICEVLSKSIISIMHVDFIHQHFAKSVAIYLRIVKSFIFIEKSGKPEMKR